MAQNIEQPQEIETPTPAVPQETELSLTEETAAPKKKKAAAKKKLSEAEKKKLRREEKKKSRVQSPYRKVILSRETLQTTIPSQVRDEAMKALGVTDPSDLLDYMFKVTWNSGRQIIEAKLVKADKLFQ